MARGKRWEIWKQGFLAFYGRRLRKERRRRAITEREWKENRVCKILAFIAFLYYMTLNGKVMNKLISNYCFFHISFPLLYFSLITCSYSSFHYSSWSISGCLVKETGNTDFTPPLWPEVMDRNQPQAQIKCLLRSERLSWWAPQPCAAKCT